MQWIQWIQSDHAGGILARCLCEGCLSTLTSCFVNGNDACVPWNAISLVWVLWCRVVLRDLLTCELCRYLSVTSRGCEKARKRKRLCRPAPPNCSRSDVVSEEPRSIFEQSSKIGRALGAGSSIKIGRARGSRSARYSREAVCDVSSFHEW